ncbi:hypothetical protein JRQ81_005617 [Phrynocephalus forsythii]|uniref:Uncharacterized protein n=1 Tax=Phrynocephalus forsythii TaxID=171643 RepID=A0A9Q0Y436_9SAUR|nr:hypothetical protein JRQ81_005617 [Phrynocephalus forsythii]
MGFIPSMLDRAKEAWAKPSLNPLMPRRVDNLYKTHGDGTDFLGRTPLPNSVIVDATQNRSKSHSSATPSNKEALKLDLIGRQHYSLVSFSLRTLNYMCAMEAYTRHVLLNFQTFLNLLPDDHKAMAMTSYNEVLSIIDYQMITSLHLTDAAAKQLMTAIHLCRHTWLRTSNITDDARNRIEDSPFDSEGLFATSMEESLDNIQKMRKAAKSYTYQGTSSQSSSRQPNQNWRRPYTPAYQRPPNGYRPQPYNSPYQRQQQQPKNRQQQSTRRFDRKQKQLS